MRTADIAAAYVGVRIQSLTPQHTVVRTFSEDAFELLNTKYSISVENRSTKSRLTYFVRGGPFLSVEVPILNDARHWWIDPNAFEEVQFLTSLKLRIKKVPNGTTLAFKQIDCQPWPVPQSLSGDLQQNSIYENIASIQSANNDDYWQHYIPQRSLLTGTIEKHMLKRKTTDQQEMYRRCQRVPGVFTTSIDVLLREYYQHIDYGLDLGRYTALNLLLLAASTNVQAQCNDVAYPFVLLMQSSLKLCAHTTVTQFDSAYFRQEVSLGENDLRCAQCATKTEVLMALSYVQKDRDTMQATFSDVLKFAKIFVGQASLTLWVDKIATRAAINMGIPETEWIKYGLVPYVLVPVLSSVGVTGPEELTHARTSIWLQMEALAARTGLGCYFTPNSSRYYSQILEKTGRQMPELRCGTKISAGRTTGALCSLKRMMAAINEREDLKPSEYWQEYYAGFRKWALALISSLHNDEDKHVLEFRRLEPIRDKWPLRETVLLMLSSAEAGSWKGSAMAVDDLYEVGKLDEREWNVLDCYRSAEAKEAGSRSDMKPRRRLTASYFSGISQRIRMDVLRELLWVGIGNERRAVFLRVVILDPDGRHTLHLHDVVNLSSNGSDGTVIQVWRWFTSRSRKLLENMLSKDQQVKRMAMLTVRDKLSEIDGIKREGDVLYQVELPRWYGNRRRYLHLQELLKQI